MPGPSVCLVTLPPHLTSGHCMYLKYPSRNNTTDKRSLFLVHLGALVVCAIVWGPTSSENFRTITSQVKWPALLPAIVITALAAAIVAVAFSAVNKIRYQNKANIATTQDIT